MKKQNKGFTIVELVIVIAVIAVLAAVLIPTFSSLIRKANLSADKQAVREMNIALAADETINGKPADIQTCMYVLAQAGYNSKNWVALTKDYQVYWYKEKNVMILYNSKTAQVEYPEEYAKTWKDKNGVPVNYFTAGVDEKGNPITMQVYNNSVEVAVNTDLSSIVSSTGGKNFDQLIDSSTTASSQQALSSIQDALNSEDSALLSTLVDEGKDAKVAGIGEYTSQDTTGVQAYAAMQVMLINDSGEPIYRSSADGKTQVLDTNAYYIQIVEQPNATAEQQLAAQKAASQMVHTLFTQINEGIKGNDAAIVLAPGTKLDASEDEWAPIKRFEGYFGTDNAEHPVIISGARLTKATSHSATITFDGSSGKYFVTGYFGSVYGDTTIENVVFENMNIDQPANDFDMTTSSKTVSRNSVSIVGGVIDGDYVDGTFVQRPANVVLRNIVVADSVNITGSATAAGLVAYVGGSGDKNDLFNGNLLIDHCVVSAKVTGLLRVQDNTGYGPCGGIIGFTCRAAEESGSTKAVTQQDGDAATSELYNVIIKDTTFNGSVDGYKDIGAVIGNMISGNVVLQGNCHFENATLNAKGYSGSTNVSGTSYVGKVAGSIGSGCGLYFEGDNINIIEGGDLIVYYNSKTSAAVNDLTSKEVTNTAFPNDYTVHSFNNGTK